jgi:peroxiredoxin
MSNCWWSWARRRRRGRRGRRSRPSCATPIRTCPRSCGCAPSPRRRRVELPEEKLTVADVDKLGPLAWTPPDAPSWNLRDAEGKSFAAPRPGESPVLILFYLGSKCSHCVQQLGKFAALAGEFRKEHLSILAVSSETLPQLAQQRAAKGGDPYPFPLLADPELKVFKEYRCFDDFENTPLHGTFLVDADPAGRTRIRWQDISYDPFMDAPFLLAECKRLLSLR